MRHERTPKWLSAVNALIRDGFAFRQVRGGSTGKSLLSVVLAVLGLTLMTVACDTSLLETIAGSIDTSETDCSQGTFRVTLETDVNDGACNSDCSLREAIIASNTCPGSNRIELPRGDYTLSLRGSGDEAGDLDIRDSVEIVGLVRPYGAVIEGRETWIERIFETHGDIEVSMEEIAILNGREDSAEGGGIFNRSDLTLSRVGLSHNQALSGGGLYNEGTATLNEVTIVENIATQPYDLNRLGGDSSGFIRHTPGSVASECGGGINNRGSMLLQDSRVAANDAGIGAGICNQSAASDDIQFQILNSEISENGSGTPASVLGGGIADFGRMEIAGSTIDHNIAANGGGIYLSSNGSGHLTLEDVHVEANESLDLGFYPEGSEGEVTYHPSGGGIYVHAGTLQVNTSHIRGNFSQYYGGGVTVGGPEEAGGAQVLIQESDIIDNQAFQLLTGGGNWGIGGGLLIDGDSAADVTLRNVTVSGNAAGRFGNGIMLLGGSSLELYHVTIARNSTIRRADGLDHGTSSRAVVRMANSIIGWHRGNACILSRVTSQGYNLVPSTCLPSTSPSTDYLATTEGELTLLPLVDVGGHLVHPMRRDSWAVDRIPAADCAPSDMVDQTGATRPIDAGCEVGAYELDETGEVIESPLVAATPTPEATEEPSKPTVTTDTLCWKGPGPLYEVVSSIEVGVEIEILGRGVQGDWWVIDNPPYPGVRCWAPGEAVEVDPNYSYPVTLFEVPPLPTPTPEPIKGCQVGPKCYPIDDCPVDFDDSDGACTP